jgi:hypothetical protein
MQNLCWIRGDLPADHPYILEEVEAIERQVEHDRINVGAGFWKPFLALKQKKVAYRFLLGGGLFLWYVMYKPHARRLLTSMKAKWLGHQRHQLLLAHRVQKHWCHRHKHRLSYHGHLRRGQMRTHVRLAPIPHRSPRPH